MIFYVCNLVTDLLLIPSFFAVVLDEIHQAVNDGPHRFQPFG